MVDILTTKNLTLEDQVRELQEAVDNLVSLWKKNHKSTHDQNLFISGISL